MSPGSWRTPAVTRASASDATIPSTATGIGRTGQATITGRTTPGTSPIPREDFDRYFATFRQTADRGTPGRITSPDVLWFDGIEMKTDAQVEDLYQMIRKMGPGLPGEQPDQGLPVPGQNPASLLRLYLHRRQRDCRQAVGIRMGKSRHPEHELWIQSGRQQLGGRARRSCPAWWRSSARAAITC